MPSASIDFLGSFKINHWYMLAIYLGAVLIVLSFVFDTNSKVTVYTSFGIDSLILGLIIWILEDTTYAIVNARDLGLHLDYQKESNAKWGLGMTFAFRWIGLLMWIYIITRTI